MTEQEAVEVMKWYSEEDYGAGSMVAVSHQMAIKALEKQVAKKPFKNDRNCGFWTCPTCNYELYWDSDYGQQKFHHCCYCGQKLDWSDEE